MTESQKRLALLHAKIIKAQTRVTYTCPSWPNGEASLLGCGHQFKAEPDSDGWLECPSCGLHFDAARSLKESP